MTEGYQRMSHSKWDCKYHDVVIPKRCHKALFGQIHKQLRAIFHDQAVANKVAITHFAGFLD